MRWLSRLLISLSLIFVGAVAFAQNSPINNPGPPLPIVPITQYGVTTASTPTAVSTAYNNAIADCNAGNIGGIFFPTGTWNFLSSPNAMTAKCVVYGVGPTTLLVFPVSDAASATTFFTVGDDTHRVAGGAIHDFQLVSNNTPTQSSYAIDIPSATDFRVYNITFSHTNSPLRVGSSTASLNPARISAWGFTGSFDKDLNGDCNFDVIAGTNIDIEGILNGTGVSNTNPTGAMVCLIPAVGKFLDTLTLDLRLQAYTGTIADLQGKPYGLLVDTTNGKVVNWTVTHRSFFDHSTVTGMLIKCSVGGSGGIEVAKIAPLRVTPDSGPAIIMDMNCGQAAQDITFINPRTISRDGAVQFQVLAAHDGGSTLYLQDQVIGAVWKNTGTSTLAAASVNADGWAFNDWTVGRFSVATPSNFTNVFSITNADLAVITIGHGSWPNVTNLIAQPTYTIPGLTTRDIWGLSSSYAGLASPALTGTPTAPTAAVDTNTTQLATTAYVIGQTYLKTATASSTYGPSDISFVISGNGSTISTGQKGYLPIDFGCTIGQARLISDQAGSIVIDVWKAAGAVPTVANTIDASALPTLSSAQLSTDSTLTGWTKTVSAGDIFGFNVNSATTVTQVTLSLKCTKS